MDQNKENIIRFWSHMQCPVCIMQGDEYLSILYANEAYYKLIGYTEKEVQYKLGGWISALLDANTGRKMRKLLKAGEPETLSIKHLIKTEGNKELWLCSMVNLIRTGQESVLCMISQDITNQKDMEKAYRYLQTKEAFLLESLDITTLEYGLVDHCVRNIHTKRLFTGVKMEGELFPQCLVSRNIVEDEQAEKLQQSVERIRSGEKRVVCELKMKNTAGETAWANLTMRLCEAEGRGYVMAVFSNVTTEKETMHKHLSQNIFYRGLVSKMFAFAHIDVTENKIIQVGGIWTCYKDVIKSLTADEIVVSFSEKVIHVEERDYFQEVMQNDNWKNSYKNGITQLECEFRRLVEHNKIAWMSVTILLFENPMNKHLLAFQYLNNVDVRKKTLLLENEEPRETYHGNSAFAQFDGFMGEVGEIAYLVNPMNYNLICGNQAFYNRIGKSEEECQNLKCYEIMHRRSRPCPFCARVNWTSEKYFMYRNYNEVLEQEFLIKNKLVQWEGKEVLLAIAVDLSNDKTILDSMENHVTENSNILSGIRNMQDAKNLHEVMESALETIGSFYRAENTRLWYRESSEDSYRCRELWPENNLVENGIGRETGEEELVSEWLSERKWNKHFEAVSQDVMLTSSFEMYERMQHYNIECQSWVVLQTDEGEELGIIEINNFHANNENISFMTSFNSFITGEWKKRNMMEKLLFNSSYDSMTGALKRVRYEVLMQKHRAEPAESLGVVSVNVDGLKNINETKDMQAGNRCLQVLVKVLQQVFGQETVYRISGDDFLVVCENCTQRSLTFGISMVEELLKEEYHFTVSMGYAWEEVEKDLEELVEIATQGMRINKKRYYDMLGGDKDQQRLEMLKEIQRIIKSGQMRIYLQPKFDARIGKLTGAEALIRYQHKLYGTVPPVEFIHKLENLQLIRYVDLFVFEEVCKLLTKWRGQGCQCPKISLNFSRLTMMENDLISSMEAIFSKYNARREDIEVEITESTEDIGRAVLNQSAKNLSNAGYSLTLDDFGTKYTNLTILSDIDVQVLKIDRSLVMSIVENEKNQKILKNVIRMCRELNIDVIAEGVETKEQQEILLSLDCHMVQGYLYSRPIEVKEFEEKFM